MANFQAQSSTRPPLLRGNTVPLIVRTSSSAQGGHERASDTPYSARPEGFEGFSSRQGESGSRRGPYSQANSPATTRPGGLHWQLGALPPTPPLSNSPGSPDSYPEHTYFPPAHGYGSAAPPNSHAYKTNGYSRPHPGTSNPSVPGAASPTVTVSPSSFQLLRSTRGPTPQSTTAEMRCETRPTEHILSAVIGPGFHSDCITIAARKGNILDIVADKWECEKDCHHEWQVQFDRDADMGGIRASYTDGVLTVTVKRLNYSNSRPPQMRP